MRLNKEHILLEIKADSIFMNSLAHLRFSSFTEFDISTNLELVQLIKGKQNEDNDYLKSILIDNYFIIELEVIGLFEERTIMSNNESILANHYGMRFYPFVSSIIKSNINFCRGHIDRVIIELPDKYRFIFDGADVRNSGKRAILRHSFSFEKSKFIFNWEEPLNLEDNNLKLNVPVRFGSITFLKLIIFPVFYWLISLLGIALASYSGTMNVVIAAIAAVWLFMLRQWNNSNLPQQNTVLTWLYIISAISVLVWGVLWEWMELYALFLLIPITLWGFLIFRSLFYFQRTGELPSLMANTVFKFVYKGDNRRLAFWQKRFESDE